MAKEYRVRMFLSPSDADKEMKEAVPHGWKPISIAVTNGGVLYVLFERSK